MVEIMTVLLVLKYDSADRFGHHKMLSVWDMVKRLDCQTSLVANDLATAMSESAGYLRARTDRRRHLTALASLTTLALTALSLLLVRWERQLGELLLLQGLVFKLSHLLLLLAGGPNLFKDVIIGACSRCPGF